LVFGLPGNPVSSLVCFELFVRPALSVLSGGGYEGLPAARGRLAAAFQHRGDRPTYFPARITAAADGERPVVSLLDWHGSADLATLAHATALAQFAPGTRSYAAGDEVEFLALR
jgi:molybdopterin molybdotransferase